MIARDFRCGVCGHVQEEWFINRQALDTVHQILRCDNPECRVQGCMERLIGAPGFTITGYSSKNGYSR